MNIKEHTTPEKLLRYSFIWSEVRLIIAAIALILGGIPLILFVVPVPALFGLVRFVLTLAWIISGLSSLYLLYQWFLHDKKLFGKDEQKDKITFFVSVVSGINLGLMGISGTNIGMSIASAKIVFLITAALYIFSAVHLYRRFKSHGEKLF